VRAEVWLGSLVLLASTSGCGRARFVTYDAGTDAWASALDAPADATALDVSPPLDAWPAGDAGGDAGADAVVDAAADVGVDAPAPIDAWTATDAWTPDPTCLPALMNPAAATDDELFRCGVARGLGACWINDTSGCMVCACTAYVRSDEICDSGSCAAPLSGTGCSDLSFYAGAPFFCTGDRIVQSACMLRYLIANGFCDGT
jgi:hypothetical protein